MELAAGTAIDRFVVEEMVGRGGMASVYRIRHRALNVAYALKVMHVTHPELSGRIKSEGALQAELRHPNIVSVFDMIEVGGLPALVMEYVDGPSLAALLDVHRPTIEQIDDIARGMIKGVRAAHAAGQIHRDLKPANVLLAHTDDGYLPKITDFGLAKSLTDGSAASVQTRTGVVMGTPAYMAPEQFRNTRSVDARADVYSLGVVLYELCAGRRPYDEEDLFDLLDRVRNADYPRITELCPQLPDRMADAIEGAMVVEPENRIQSVEQLYEVWCGESRIERSQAWNRSVLQQIGTMLSGSDTAAPLAAPPGTQTPPPIEPSVPTPQPVQAQANAPAAPEAPAPQLLGTLGPELLGRSLSAAPTDNLAADDAPAPTPFLSPPVDFDGPDDTADDGPVDDGTRFELRVNAPASDAPSEPSPPTAPVVAAPVAGPPAVPAALAGASILVQSEPVGAPPVTPSALSGPPSGPPSTPGTPRPAPNAAGGSKAPVAARPRVPLTDSTPSLHLPSSTTGPGTGATSTSTPPSASGTLGASIPPATAPSGGGWIRTVAVLAVAGIAVVVVGGGLFTLLTAGTLTFMFAPGTTADTLPVIEVPGGANGAHPDGDGADGADGADGGDGVAASPDPDGGTDATDPNEDGQVDAGDGNEATPSGPDEAGDATPAPTPAPGPKPRPQPRPKVAKGRVRLTGDASSISLVGGGHRYGPGLVPEGTYELRATFPGQGELPQRASVTVDKDRETVINCVSGFFSCSVK